MNGRDVIWLTVMTATLLVGYFLGLEEETPRAVGIVLTTILLSALVSSYITASNYGSRLRKLLGLTRLADIQKSVVDGMKGKRFFSHDEVRLIELSVSTDEIWVVTDDIAFDAAEVGDSFRASVVENNTRGINYRYVIPEWIGEAAENAFLQGLDRKQVSVVRLSSENWRQLPFSDGAVIIYNPSSATGFDDCRAFFDFPAKDSPMWAEVERRVAIDWADRINRLIT